MAQVNPVAADALHWVKDELGISIERVRAGVDDFLMAPYQALPLQRCMVELHQVRGTLCLIQCEDAALLAEEMRNAVHDLLPDIANVPEQALEVLLGASVQLLDYLDLLAAGERGSGLVFLPLINELCVARSAPVLNEADLFVRYCRLLGLNGGPPEPVAAAQASAAQRLARESMSSFQTALLAVLRNQRVAVNLARLAAIVESMASSVAAGPGRQLFVATGALLEALQDRGVDNDLAIRRLLGWVGQQLKAIAENGGDALASVPDSLLFGVVFQAGRSASAGERVTALRTHYALEKHLPERAELERLRGRLRSPNTGLVKQLSAAIKADFASVKDAIDRALRADGIGSVRVRELVSVTTKIADTLGMLGLEALQRIMNKQTQRLRQVADHDAPQAGLWMDLALALLRVEQNLDRHLFVYLTDGTQATVPLGESRADVDAAFAAVYREALVNLAHIKASLTEFMGAERAPQMVGVERLLHELWGGLRLLGHDRQAEWVDGLQGFITPVALAQVVDHSEQIDLLADAVAAIELHLEALRENRADAQSSCARAEASVQALRQAPATAAASPQRQAAMAAPVGSASEPIDPVIRDTFLAEAEAILTALACQVPAWATKLRDVTQLARIRRGFHTLEGSARMVRAAEISALARAVEQLLNRCLQEARARDAEVLAVVTASVRMMPDLIGAFRDGCAGPDVAAILADVERILSAPAAASGDSADTDINGLFQEEAAALLRQIDDALEDWRKAPDDGYYPGLLHQLCHTLQGSAPAVGADAVGALAKGLGQAVVAAQQRSHGPDGKTFEALQTAVVGLRELLKPASLGGADTDPEPWLTPLRTITAAPLTEAEQSAIAVNPGRTSSRNEEVDDELIAVFLDEAAVLLKAVEQACRQWQAQPWNAHAQLELARNLHTLKGSARVAGLEAVGTVSHVMETVLARAAACEAEHRTSLLATLSEGVAGLDAMLQQVRSGHLELDSEPLLVQLRAGLEATPDPATHGDPEANPVLRQPSAWNAFDHAHALDAPDADATGLDAGDQSSAPHPVPGSGAAPPRGAPETVRVAVSALEHMLNEVGELSIQRAHLAEQDVQSRIQLHEMGRVAPRMDDQLRRLETEFDALMAVDSDQGHVDVAATSARPQAQPTATLHELSRSLAESVTDLVSLHGLLTGIDQEREALARQQQELTTSLRQHLIDTVMVPFSRQASYLRRVVGQMAAETGREAEIVLVGAESELDRGVLEHLSSPLAHLLRNAVVHGLEAPEARLAAGKPRCGEIRVQVQRRGTELVLDISDDGCGLDFGAIRATAMARGLLEPDATISDADATRFIFQPGFSTAGELTQAAGRGIGLDVVNNEIKQLGGNMSVSSVAGSGTRFLIHVPMTLAASRALMVHVGNESYAVPVSSVEGVTRVSRSALAQQQADAHATIEYGGDHYGIQQMDALLGLPPGEPPDADCSHLPALLVRRGEDRAAVVVDAIRGSRDIVIKPVGSQVASVPGVSAATIQADGRVVLILDVATLLQRHGPAIATCAENAAAVALSDHRPLALVVDDSITIRRISERFLSQHGFRVTTAYDGVAAQASLAREVPDVLLLDIEMPRMDGFELTAYIREHAALANIPIVMISTRGGESHRERAKALGVNRFLSKPYQEHELLTQVRALLRQADQMGAALPTERARDGRE